MESVTYTASTPRDGHICNCIGCCSKCGTCRTWHGHTKAYCELLQRQAVERAAALVGPEVALPAEPQEEAGR